MQYVYRYISGNQVLYVGITSDMRRRVREHTVDKLRDIKNATIQYFPVESRTDAELIETYLISATDSCKKYNVSKASKESGTFLKSITFPWKEYFGRVSADDEPFRIQPEKVIQEKVVYTDKVVYKERTPSINSQINEIWKLRLEWNEYFSDELSFEFDVMNMLRELYLQNADHENVLVILRGMYVHSERHKRLCELQVAYERLTYEFSENSRDKLQRRHRFELAKESVNEITDAINEFESEIGRTIWQTQ